MVHGRAGAAKRKGACLSLTVGQNMQRVDDGMRGIVIIDERGTPRISYLERGERRLAGKGEKWEEVVPPPRKMRREEMLKIARFADSALRAAMLHEPMKWWMTDVPTFDQGLVDVIVSYLEERK